MTITELAAIVSAIALCVLVALVAMPMIRLGRTLEEATTSMRQITERAVPLLDDMAVVVRKSDAELDRLQTVTEDAGKVASHAADVSEEAAQFSKLVNAVVGKPLVKTAAFTYAARKAIGRPKK